MQDDVFPISETIQNFVNMKIDPDTGEILDGDTSITTQQFEEIELNRQAKQLNLIQYYKLLDGKTDIINAEIERLSRLKQITANKQKALKWLLNESMLSNNEKKIEFDTCSATIKKNPGALVIEPGAEKRLTKYVKVEMVEKIDKNAVKDDLKSGVEIDGVYIKESESLIIK